MTTIRKATQHDAVIIATYLLLAMEDIVYRFIGEEDSQKAREFMTFFVKKDNTLYSYHHCWVVEVNTKIVAAVNVYDGARFKELQQPIVEYLQTLDHSNIPEEDETQAGEYYIDALGVDPDEQGKGFGTKLMKFVIDEFVQKHNQPLGLLVDVDNLGAKKLYQTLGFQTCGRKVLFGKTMEHMQIKGSVSLAS